MPRAHPHRPDRARTGLVAGYADLADPDHWRVAAYARLLAYRLRALSTAPPVEKCADPGQLRATLSVAYLFTGSVADGIVDEQQVTAAHVTATAYIADLLARGRSAAAGVMTFGGPGDLVDADTLDRLARAAHRRVCAAGAEHPAACHPDPGRVRLRLVHPHNPRTGTTRPAHRDLEPSCIVHAGHDLAELTAGTDGADVTVIGPPGTAQAVRGYAGQVRAAVIRGGERGGERRTTAMPGAWTR